MPKLTCFEILNVSAFTESSSTAAASGAAASSIKHKTPSLGGFIMSRDDVKQQAPEAYEAWMCHVRHLQLIRTDFPGFSAKGRSLDSIVDVKFFRTHPTKDITRVAIGSLFPLFSPSHLQYCAHAIGKKPCLMYMSGASTFNQFLGWAGVVKDTAFVPTGYPDIVEPDAFVTAGINSLVKKMGGYADIGTLPVFSNEQCGEVFVSYKRPKGAGVGSEIIGVALSVVKMCVLCHCVATSETARDFKMCSRCKLDAGAVVYYCSSKCQKDDYPRHSEVCRDCGVVAKYKAEYIEAAAAGADWAVCQFCGAKPTASNIHMFHRCARCMRNGGHVILYCGSECQRQHYSVHKVDCVSRLKEAESGNLMNEIIEELDRVCDTTSDQGNRLKCGELREELTRLMQDAGLEPE